MGLLDTVKGWFGGGKAKVRGAPSPAARRHDQGRDRQGGQRRRRQDAAGKLHRQGHGRAGQGQGRRRRRRGQADARPTNGKDKADGAADTRRLVDEATADPATSTAPALIPPARRTVGTVSGWLPGGHRRGMAALGGASRARRGSRSVGVERPAGPAQPAGRGRQPGDQALHRRAVDARRSCPRAAHVRVGGDVGHGHHRARWRPRRRRSAASTSSAGRAADPRRPRRRPARRGAPPVRRRWRSAGRRRRRAAPCTRAATRVGRRGDRHPRAVGAAVRAAGHRVRDGRAGRGCR